MLAYTDSCTNALLIGQFVGELPPQLSLLAGSNRAS